MVQKKSYGVYLRLIPDYITIMCIGIPLGALFFLLVLLGRIKIKGYVRAMRLVACGKVIIVANHPTMLEIILIPLLFFPMFLLSLRFFVWSVPDRRLLSSRLRWLFWLGRCVTIDRSDRSYTKYTLRRLTEILNRNGVVIIHPEAGRTFKGDKFVVSGNRRIRSFISGVPSLARNTGAIILPLWVSGTDIVMSGNVTFPRFMRSKIVLSFGTSYRPAQQKGVREVESSILAHAILAS